MGAAFTAVADEACAASDAPNCKLQEAITGSDSTESLQLLQKKTGEKKDAPALVQHKKFNFNPDDVMDQLKGAVSIDSIKKKISDATGSAKSALEDQLSKLQDAFPAADEVKEKFADQWDQITEGMNIQSLQDKLEKAMKGGNEKLVNSLEGKLDDMKKEFPDVSVDSIKDKATQTWDKLTEDGDLPDIDDLRDKAKSMAGKLSDMMDDSPSEIKDKLSDAASEAASKVKDKMSDAASAAADKLKGFFR